MTQTRTLAEVMAVLSTLTLNSVLRGKPLSDSNASVCTLSLAPNNTVVQGRELLW